MVDKPSSLVRHIQICLLRLALSGVRFFRHLAGSLTFIYLSVFLLFWLPFTGVCRVLKVILAKSALRCMRSISAYFHGLYHGTGRARTSCTHFN